MVERQALETLVQHYVRPLATRLHNEMTRLWKEGAPGIDHLLYCGGGSALLASYLGQFRDDYTILPESQFTNAARLSGIHPLTSTDQTRAQDQGLRILPG